MKKFIGTMMLGAVVMLAGCGEQKSAKAGDTVVIDFAGYLDGVQFPGGTAEGFPLTLGSGQFVPGFEDQLVGVKKGEEREIKITFPENYPAKELAGKETVFKVKITDIKG
ncbi:MAG: FKBP-type peptidyl-prolyl cis-trans isomerase [Rickettsiales bacterium]|jgi:trigger factor|nr:FKBP-type peptidyl-prolyl cis-trans isomerase [Rickettsiales bacterium]